MSLNYTPKNDSPKPCTAGRRTSKLLQIIHSIIEAANDFEKRGHSDIWIYSVQGQIHLSRIALVLPASYFVAYFPVKDLLQGLSKPQRKELYEGLAIVRYLTQN